MNPTALHADMRDALRDLVAAGEVFHAVVTDPPYHLTSIVDRWRKGGPEPKGDVYARASRGFMGKDWDGGDIAMRPETWWLAWQLLPPGGHLVAFGGTRTFHRMACAIEDAGFELRDTLMWLYGSGFPKSHDTSKGIDKALGAERSVLAEGAPVARMIPGADQNATGSWTKDNGRTYVPQITAAGSAEAAAWEGWGTALKPAWEPIILARKPLAATVAANVLAHGTGALNVDGCRIALPADDALHDGVKHTGRALDTGCSEGSWGFRAVDRAPGLGRWPANVVHDGSEEVETAFATFGADKGAAAPVHRRNGDKFRNAYGTFKGNRDEAGSTFQGDSGTASRFFYGSKAGAADRVKQCEGCGLRFHGARPCACDAKVRSHPTVKPIDLMRWLCRLVTPPGGRILDPFAGSGSTLAAAHLEGFRSLGVEREAEYHGDILWRLAQLGCSPLPTGVLKPSPGTAAATPSNARSRAGREPALLPLFQRMEPAE